MADFPVSGHGRQNGSRSVLPVRHHLAFRCGHRYTLGQKISGKTFLSLLSPELRPFQGIDHEEFSAEDQVNQMSSFPLFETSKRFSAFLFDMDGTILSSAVPTDRVWGAWAERHGLDPKQVLPRMHGQRGVDAIRQLNLPDIDPDIEAARITEAEIEDVDGVVAIPGAAEFLAALPPERWAIVTSSTRRLALRRLEAAGLTAPRFMVTGEDVTRGKPDPQCYILGAEKVGVSTTDCLVFEDVEPGVKAGEAAGAHVLVITTNTLRFPNHQTVGDYTRISPAIADDGTISIVREDPGRTGA